VVVVMALGVVVVVMGDPGIVVVVGPPGTPIVADRHTQRAPRNRTGRLPKASSTTARGGRGGAQRAQ
jgi:hypothetical protein